MAEIEEGQAPTFTASLLPRRARKGIRLPFDRELYYTKSSESIGNFRRFLRDSRCDQASDLAPGLFDGIVDDADERDAGCDGSGLVFIVIADADDYEIVASNPSHDLRLVLL